MEVDSLLVNGTVVTMDAAGTVLPTRQSPSPAARSSRSGLSRSCVPPSLYDNPGGIFAVVLSMFPVTAPVTMTMRLAEGAVPAWQQLLSAGLLFLGVLGSIFLAARLFRDTTLLAGVRPTPGALWRMLRAG